MDTSEALFGNSPKKQRIQRSSPKWGGMRPRVPPQSSPNGHPDRHRPTNATPGSATESGRTSQSSDSSADYPLSGRLVNNARRISRSRNAAFRDRDPVKSRDRILSGGSVPRRGRLEPDRAGRFAFRITPTISLPCLLYAARSVRWAQLWDG